MKAEDDYDVWNAEVIGLDTETTGLKYPVDSAFCVSVASLDGRTAAYDFRAEGTKRFKSHLRSSNVKQIVCHNASFDYRMLHSAGVSIPLELFDCTAVRATLINEHESTFFPWTKRRGDYSLDSLCSKYLGEKKTGSELYEALAGIFGGLPTRNVQMPRISSAPWDIVEPYVRRDAWLAVALWDWQRVDIASQGLEAIVAFERDLLPLLINTELEGIRVDIDAADKARAPLAEETAKKQHELDKLAGKPLNVNSAPQIRDMFKPKRIGEDWYVGDYLIGTTPKGQPSLGGDILKNMPDPRAELIGEIRSLIKTKDTFLAKHVIDHSVDGRVYPTINQTKGEDGGTGTGRLSYTEPALQQIPSRNKKVAAIVKPCFLPDEGQVWVDSDMASFEVRVFAHLVAAFDPRIAERYRANPQLDFHQYVGDLTGLVRNATYNGQPNAKQLNLSMIFTQGKGATAAKMGMPWTWEEFTSKEDGNTIRYQKAGREAEAVIAKYHRELPGVTALSNKCKEIVKQHGYIKTEYGRKLRFPNNYKLYKSSGLLIQSTSADFNKRNWGAIDKAIRPHGGRILLNTHDSYSMSLPEDWKPVYSDAREAIESIDTRVPMLLDLNGAGSNWWQALSGE